VASPLRAPLACGALGSYDRARVARIASRLGDAPQPVHEDGSSILLLDREPLTWGAGRERGLGWLEGDLRQLGPGLGRREDAAKAGLCGLGIAGGRRFLYTAANGLAPIYWTEEGGAIYFASRIDPLVRASSRPFSIDWDAWASIIAMRHPLGERTPFAEIRRLPQSATLRRRLGRARVERHPWAWAEIEHSLDLESAAEQLAAALEEVLAPLSGEVACPLSGGRDSRMLFLALARDGRASSAVTVNDDEGDTHEEDLAAPVAAHFGIEHERLLGRPEDYPAEWEERASRVEYEFVDHAWLMPVARRMERSPAPVPDGFALDVFLPVGHHFYAPETFDPDGRAAARALFGMMRRYGKGEGGLAERFRAPIQSRASDQFLAATKDLHGHPSQPMLSLYATRSRRGVSTYSTKLIGDGAQTVTPGASDPIVSVALGVGREAKGEGNLYRGVFRRLAPGAAELPATAETPRRRPHLPRRWRSAAALAAHRARLEDGPLAPHVSPRLLAWLERPDGELGGDLRLGMEGVGLLHAWWQRYRDCLREVDPADLLG